MELTSHQYGSLTAIQRRLVEVGVHPSVAGRLVRRAMRRVLSGGDAGLGKVHQVRRVQRERIGIPRPQVAGERCVTIRERPGQETAMWRDIDEYRARGWNIMDVGRSHGFPAVSAYYACPPGQMPRVAQPLILQSQEF